MVTECCLFPKGKEYWKLSNKEYYRYLKKKFKCIRKKKKILDILYSCLAFDPLERLTVPQLIKKYFKNQSESGNEREAFVEDNRSPISPCKENIEFPESNTTPKHSYISSPSLSAVSSIVQISMEDTINYNDMDLTKTGELIFKYENFVEASRWDSYHNKWRNRGIGTLHLYYIREMNITKLVFDDTKYNKIRLLQWVDNDTKCEFVNDDEVIWNGKDYSMNTRDPVNGKWKLQFEHDVLSLNIKQFADLFNNYTHRPSKHRQSFMSIPL